MDVSRDVSNAHPEDAAAEGPSSFYSQARAALEFALSSWLFHVAIISFLLLQLFLEITELEHHFVGTLGFALDDAWIHMTVARNLVEGLGYGINPGRTVSVSTSPTWTLLLAGAYSIFRQPVMANLFVSLLSQLAACIICYFLIRKLTGRSWLAVVGAIIFMYDPIPLWGLASGMELPFAAAVLFATLYLYHAYGPETRARLIGVPILLGFSAITRPELLLLIPLAMLDTFSLLYENPATRKLAVRTFLIQGAIVLLTLLPYFLFNKISTNLLFPTSYYAKTRVRGVGFAALLRHASFWSIIGHVASSSTAEVLEVANYFVSANLALFLLAVPGAFAFSKTLGTENGKNGRLMALAFFILPFAMGALAPARHLSNHANRYYVVFPIMAVVLAMSGIDLILRKLKAQIVASFCLALMLCAPMRDFIKTVDLLIRDVDSTERLYHAMGVWVRDHLPKDAVLAVNDIGGLGYFAKRDFIDIMGLATPEIWTAISHDPGEDQDLNKLRRFLIDNKVEYVILCPLYYPPLTGDTKAFEPIMQWSERITHNRLISPQVLYKTHWPKE